MREAILAALICALSGCGGEEPSLRGAPPEAQASAEGAACEHHEEHVEVAPSGPQPSAVLADGARQFGGSLTDLAPTALSAISASPTSFDGQTVRTEGTIERVCQRMGCWMELRAEGSEPVRVPMAGHSFFLPRDVAGHPATIEGRVQVTPLSPERRAHLESEGALATAGDLSIEATSVVVR
jgi:hypothetical protein